MHVPPFLFGKNDEVQTESHTTTFAVFTMRQLLLRGLSGSSVCIALDSASTTVENVQERIFSAVGVPPEHQKLVLGGKVLTQDVLESVSASDVIFVSLSLRVVGGKGGFGSLLRGGQSGPNAKKITNFGSMRDLQGRRIKDVVRIKLHLLSPGTPTNFSLLSYSCCPGAKTFIFVISTTF